MSITIYGIKNCDTMKKARSWLEQHDLAYTFHDYKTQGVEAERLDSWIGKVGWEILLNRAGTTFKKLAEDEKRDLDAGKAKALMLAQPSMIKRPVVEAEDGGLIVGFKPEIYREAFGQG